MRLRRTQICPIHHSRFCCGREAIPKDRGIRQTGIRRVDDPQHPRGFRELRSNADHPDNIQAVHWWCNREKGSSRG